MDVFIYENDQYMLAPPDLTAEIERLQEERLIERERNLRVLADFRNYRRRVEHDVRMLAEVSRLGLMDPALNIISDLQNLCSANNQLVITLI